MKWNIFAFAHYCIFFFFSGSSRSMMASAGSRRANGICVCNYSLKSRGGITDTRDTTSYYVVMREGAEDPPSPPYEESTVGIVSNVFYGGVTCSTPPSLGQGNACKSKPNQCGCSYREGYGYSLTCCRWLKLGRDVSSCEGLGNDIVGPCECKDTCACSGSVFLPDCPTLDDALAQ